MHDDYFKHGFRFDDWGYSGRGFSVDDDDFEECGDPNCWCQPEDEDEW